MYKTIGEAVDLVEELLAGLGNLTDREVLICPPFTALYPLSPLLAETQIALGAQDLYFETQGAFTGAVSPTMLRDVGCRYVIVGHSERRQIFGEDDALVNKKLHAALKNGLRPIVCVGESKPQRDSGDAEKIVVAQVRADLAGVSTAQMDDVVIAYEPIWAIGTGVTATSEDAQNMCGHIRGVINATFGDDAASKVRIQYGGSVKPGNIAELMSQPDVDGALVGGAALDPDEFAAIVQYRNH